MTGRGTWAVLGLLAALGVALALLSDSAPASSWVPSVHNPGPNGLGVLWRYLTERGHPVWVLDAQPGAAWPGRGALVIAGPTARRWEGAELDRLRRFVEVDGNTLIYLTPGDSSAQPALESWLRLQRVRLSTTPLRATRDAEVWWRVGPAAHAARLSTRSGLGVRIDQEAAMPLTSLDLLWRAPMGRGVVWVGTLDLATNRSLSSGDQLALWEAWAAQGPLVFDELHHLAPARPPLSSSLVGFAAQLLLLFGVFVWARGSRLGPPRPRLLAWHRSTLESAAAFATLLRRSRAEQALAHRLADDFRALLHRELLIPLGLSDAEAARALAQQRPVAAAHAAQVLQAARTAPATLSSRGYHHHARAIAQLEQVVLGTAPSP